MRLLKLRIGLQTYGDDAGKYVGKAEFSDGKNDIHIYLTPEHCDQIFAVCADSIISVSKAAAHELRCAIIEQVKSIPIIEQVKSIPKDET